MSSARPLAAISLKAYLGHSDSLRWLEQTAAAAGHHSAVEVAALPLVTALPEAAARFGAQVSLGVQHISRYPAGAYTGEVPASVTVELGATYAEIAHAERRRYFGDGDAEFAQEVEQAVGAGLTPLVCAGEPARTSPREAAEECTRHLNTILAPLGGRQAVVAYEPEWAIGASEPAPPEYVRAVMGHLHEWGEARGFDLRLIYGGTAGPGTFAALYPVANGLFLGRRAHDVAALSDVLTEMTTLTTGVST